MVALKPILIIKEKKEALLKEQKALIKILKTRHKEAYNWMKENNINILDLKTYSGSIAAALVIGLTATTSPPQSPTLVQPVKVIELTELSGKSEEEKADIVWKRYGHVIRRNGRKYDVDPKLIYATIMLESGGNTYAVRQEPTIGDASYGLGQILYGTALGIGFEGTPNDLFDPEVNIDLIARYHKRNQDVYGDLSAEELTIAYNAGSPYSAPNPGHITKFNKWYKKVNVFIG